ncbi:cysteine-rich venom protein ENH1 isoform X2 [Anolis carolinensis]|uniref:cysteine-rich venom protein ENH1 isoform X2 n=1 Tax=Anolis carolinensis TaxID=28377 RepID=UPI002F2B7458
MKEMLLLSVLLPLAAVLQQALGKTIVSKMSPKKQLEILDHINDVRRNVEPTASNMMKMVWSDEASASAGKWVSQCHFRNSPKEERISNNVVCGETLSQTMTPSSWPDVIQSWASTKHNFKYGIGPIDPKKNIYSYTQLIWYNSHMVGCALAYCKGNSYPYLYSCHFCPSGNIQDKIAAPYKEGPSCADCPSDCDDKLCTNACPYKNVYSECEKMKNLFSCESNVMVDNCQALCRCPDQVS